MKWFKLIIIFLAAVFFSGCNLLDKNSKSGLQVITDGTDSAVFLDGQYLEKSPFINREIKPGEYTLKIQPDDSSLVAYETKIRLRPGLLTVVTWKLAARPELSGGVIYEMEPIKSKSKSEVSFITIPDGAIVSLQGRDKDFSPVIMSDINPGNNEFEVSLPSYESQKHTINVVEGYRMLVSVKLAKIDVNNLGNQKKSESEIEETKKTGQTEGDSTGVVETESKTITRPRVMINSTNFFQDGLEVLRVRDQASSTGKELGFAVVGDKYDYLGTTTDNWLNISFNEKTGWVSGSYAQIINNDK